MVASEPHVKTISEFVREEIVRFKYSDPDRVTYQAMRSAAKYMMMDKEMTDRFVAVMFPAVRDLVGIRSRRNDHDDETEAFAAIEAPSKHVDADPDGDDSAVPLSQPQPAKPFRRAYRHPVRGKVIGTSRPEPDDPWLDDMAATMRELRNTPIRGLGANLRWGTATRAERLEKRDKIYKAASGYLNTCSRIEQSVKFTDQLDADTVNEALAKIDDGAKVAKR